MTEITESELLKIGFVFGNYPEIVFQLNEKTSLVLVYAESNWYSWIIQFGGFKPPKQQVYIPKKIQSIEDVHLLIKALKEN